MSKYAQSRKNARVTRTISIRLQGDRMLVSAPYSESFRSAASVIGNYRFRTGQWSFPQAKRDEVMGLLETIYGYQGK